MDISARNGLCGLAKSPPQPRGCSTWFGGLGVGTEGGEGLRCGSAFGSPSPASPLSHPDLLGFQPHFLSHLGIWQSAEDSLLVPSMSAASEKEMASMWVTLGSLWADRGQGWLR